MTGELQAAEVNPPAIAPEPQEDAQNDEGAIEIPESGLTGLDDASMGQNDASTIEPEKPQEVDGIELGGWRYLSCGRKNGRARFRLALGSGRARKWQGRILTVGQNNSIAERNRNESTKQDRQKATVNHIRGGG